MMILQSLLLFLIPSVLHILVLAAPIPNDHHASTHTNAPATHPPAVQLNTNAHPVRHAPVQPGQTVITGTMPAHPDARGAGGMTQHQLDDHARHIAANLRVGPNAGPYVVHATHTPGHMNVRFKAVEDRQNRWAHNPEGHKDTAHHTLDVQANRRPVVNTPTMTDAQRNAMHQGLQNRAHQHTWHPVAAQPGQHGEGRHGTLMVDPAHQGSGLTQDQLKVHANFVAQHLFPHPQDHNVRIEVQHKPGDAHAHYRAVTADGGVINHHRGPTPQEAQAIRDHVAGHFAAGTAHQGGSINGPGNPLTFTGAIPAHPNIPHHVSPGHMQVYSSAIKTGLANQYGLTPQERNGLVVATLRTPGSNQVLFDTQPRHADVFNSANNLHPDLTQAHQNVGHVLNQSPNLPMVHADSRVLNHHLTNVGAAPGTASQHLQGAVLGIDGMGNQPCQNCHNVVSQFPVHYEGRNRAVHPNVQRAIDV